jgi:hypothetical protein
MGSAEEKDPNRSLAARIGAHSLHARYDSTELTGPARAGFLARFEREVDPEGRLPQEERARRAQHALQVHMLRLAVKSAQVRRRRRG